MKPSKIRELDEAELNNQIREMDEQMFRLRLQINMGQSEGLKKYRVLRKDKARVLTILRERQLGAAAESE